MAPKKNNIILHYLSFGKMRNLLNEKFNKL
jgi:hypothetical protein